MSDNLFQPFADALKRSLDEHRALSPHMRNVARVRLGAELLVGGVFTIWWSRAFLGARASDLVTALLHGRTTFSVWLPLVIWAFTFLLGSFWVVVGLTGQRPLRQPTEIFWQVLRVALFVGLLLFAYVPVRWGWPLINLALGGLYLSNLVGHSLDLALQVIGPRRLPVPPTPPPPTFQRPIFRGPSEPPPSSGGRGAW